MTASEKITLLAEMTSFPRKRESISVSESRNLKSCIAGSGVYLDGKANRPNRVSRKGEYRVVSELKVTGE